MKKFIAVASLLVLLSANPFSHRASAQVKEEAPAKVLLAAECLDEMNTVRPGMTRADLLKVYNPGGLFLRPADATFSYKGSSFFLAKVVFKNQSHDGDGKIIESPNDVIESIYGPYTNFTHYKEKPVVRDGVQVFEISESGKKTIKDCLKEISKIKPGMKRSDFMKVFTYEGGFHICPNPTFEYQDCRAIKVDVTFVHLSKDADGSTLENPDDLVKSLSQPYVGPVYCD